MRPLKIAYLCDISPEHTQPYSGGNARMHRALSERAEVTVLPQAWGLAEPVRQAIYRLPDAAQLRTRWRMHLALARVIAAPLSRQIATGGFDAVFCAYSFQSLSRLRTPPGVLRVFTSDATPTIYKRSEIGRAFGSSLTSRLLLDPLTRRAEHRVFSGLDLMLCPSGWLCAEAKALYRLRPGIAHTLPWGANIADPGTPPPRPITRDQPVELLVIGRDWFAKGGPLAFDTMKALRSRGHDARLTVIGATPPDFHMNEHVTALGPLDRSKPEDAALFRATLRAAHFLVQPSFESYGFAFCEAAAFGLPSLCLDIGGVPVRDGTTGHPLPPGSGPQDFAARIAEYIENPGSYAALRQSARSEYETRLNWPAWAEGALSLMQEKLAAKR